MSLLFRIFGKPIRGFIDRYFNLLSVLFTVLLIGGFLVIRYWHAIADFFRALFQGVVAQAAELLEKL